VSESGLEVELEDPALLGPVERPDDIDLDDEEALDRGPKGRFGMKYCRKSTSASETSSVPRLAPPPTR
jgi:hypothetical protein